MSLGKKMTTIKRECLECKGPLVLLVSQNKKICADCKKLVEWTLDVGQQPIFEGKHDG